MKLLFLSLVLAEVSENLPKKRVKIAEDGLLCYQCDAAKDNGSFTRGEEACFNPKTPNNLIVGDAGPNGTCISTYWETTTSEGNKMTAIERRFHGERYDTNQGFKMT